MLENMLRKIIRDHYKTKQCVIASEAGISRGFMSDWMNGKRGISVKNFEVILSVLKIEIAITHNEKLIGKHGVD